jgi:predicted DNA-binding protein with PD1-like motif
MKSKVLANRAQIRTLALILEQGEEAFATISNFAELEGIRSASLTAIGAFEYSTVGWFDFDTRRYVDIPVREQCEVLSAIGDIAIDESGSASLHMHVVLGLSDGTTRGGHLIDALVHPILEVIITETPAELHRKRHPELGISLLEF